ncbi:MAG: type II toxin-antitoxin system RelE family toxin [Olsenella sp.]
MTWHVEYTDGALKQLKKMDRFDAKLITSWIG